METMCGRGRTDSICLFGWLQGGCEGKDGVPCSRKTAQVAMVLWVGGCPIMRTVRTWC